MPEIEAPALLHNRPATPVPAPGGNPLLEDWSAFGGVPPFSRIVAEQFLPAYAQGLAEHVAEIAAIAAAPGGNLGDGRSLARRREREPTVLSHQLHRA